MIDPDAKHDRDREEAADYRDEVRDLVNEARKLSPELAASIDAARKAGHKDFIILRQIRIALNIAEMFR